MTIRALLVLLSAGLGILAFPPIHWHPLAAVSLIPLMFALRGTEPKQGLLLGFLYGLSLFGGTVFWLVQVFGPLAILLIFILSIFPMGFGVLTAGLDRHFGKTLAIPGLIAMAWLGFEFFRCEWFTLRFPWITPGTGLPPGFLTPIIGVYGISFAIALGAAGIAWGHRKMGASILIAIAAAAYVPRPSPAAPTLKIASVQAEGVSFAKYMELSEGIDAPVDAIVWPECAVTYDIRKSPEKVAAIQVLLKRKDAAHLTLGTREDLDADRWANIALTIGPDGVLGSHHKNRPVHLFDDGEPGSETTSFETPLGRMATTICFDNDYEAVVRAATRSGAEFFLIPSMDAVHWGATQHLQHAELVRHRAAENSRWMAVASSSGLTQTVDPNGQRMDRLPLFARGVLISEIGRRSQQTIYTMGGWLIGPLGSALTVILIIGCVIIDRKRRATGEAMDPSD